MKIPRVVASQKGFTLLETLVAFSILVAGIAVFLWQMRQQATVTQRQSEFLFALEAVQNDLESLQGLQPDWVHDTAYELKFQEKTRFQFKRRVYDTLDFSESREDLRLDGELHPVALKEPREVQVSVYRLESGANLWDSPWKWSLSNWGEPTSDAKKPLVQITTRLPEYLP